MLRVLLSHWNVDVRDRSLAAQQSGTAEPLV